VAAVDLFISGVDFKKSHPGHDIIMMPLDLLKKYLLKMISNTIFAYYYEYSKMESSGGWQISISILNSFVNELIGENS
jgi:hypothetical protein